MNPSRPPGENSKAGKGGRSCRKEMQGGNAGRTCRKDGMNCSGKEVEREGSVRK
jgi:hypothetical protein